jgi:hypothetical protein
MAELTQKQVRAVVFLRMAAIEMRRIADRAPDVAVELRHMARQLDAEADALSAPNTE